MAGKNMAFFVDRFSAGLDELTRKQQRDPVAVLRVLHRVGRFSTFEASENQAIASTVTTIMRSGWVEDIGGDYPWTNVRLTPEGLRLIGDQPAPARERE